MSREDAVAETLARRLTDAKIKTCHPSLEDRTKCGAHSGTYTLFRLPPGGACMKWRDEYSTHRLVIGGVIDDPVAKDLLLEVWDA